MANDVIPDPNVVPGPEGVLPPANQDFPDSTTRDDPATTGIDDDGTAEMLNGDPLDAVGRQTEDATLQDPSHLVRQIPDPVDSDDEMPADPA